MRFHRYAIILVIIVAFLTGAYFIIDRITGSDNKGATEKIQLLELDAGEIQSLTIKNNEGEFIFEKDDNTWELVSGGDFRVDFLRLNNIASTIADLYAERIIEKDAKDLEKYGLLDSKVITLKTVEGETVVVELGNPTATNESYYIKLNEDTTIYTMPYYEGDILNATKTDIRSKHVIDNLRSELIKFGFERDGELVVTVERQGERAWGVIEPFKIDGNIAHITNAIDAYIRTNIHGYVEESAKDLGIYGLDKPLYAIETETKDGEKLKLLVGKEKGMNFDTYVNEIYAALEGSTEVFLIDIGPLKFLEESVPHFANNYIYTEDLNHIEGAYVEVGDKKINLEIERFDSDESEKTIRYYVDGKEVAEDGIWHIRELYRTLMAVDVMEIDFAIKPPEEQPENSMTFYLNKEPKEVTIEFIPRDDASSYAIRNGEYTGLIGDSTCFDIILDTYEILLEYLID